MSILTKAIAQYAVLVLMLLCFYSHAVELKAFESFVKLSANKSGAGVAYIVTKDGQTLYADAYGMANVESGSPLTTDTPFNIASLSKQFTAVAIMMLQEQGKLSVEDNINKYLSDFPTRAHNISIKHLLSHTAGLARDPRDKGKLSATAISIEQLVSLLAAEKMQGEPGAQMLYSNMGYVLLGRIIEVVSGQAYGEYIEKNIFDKLGMQNSHYGGHNVAGRAEGYFRTRKGTDKRATPPDVSWAYAAGGLLTSVNDFALWYQALVVGKLISADSYLKMTQKFSLNDGRTSNYGFGLNNSELHSRRMIMHQGATPGYRTSAFYFPEEGINVVVFSNLGNSNTFDLTALLSGEIFGLEYPEFKPVTLTKQQQENISGEYQTRTGATRTLFVEENILYSRVDNALVYSVTPMVNNVFLFDNSLSYFTINKDDAGRQIMQYYSDISSEPEVAVKR